MTESEGKKKKKIKIKFGKILQRPTKKFPRSVKPPEQSPFFPNLSFLTQTRCNQYNKKVQAGFKNSLLESGEYNTPVPVEVKVSP